MVKKNKSVQIWSYCIPLERKFDADEDSYKKHGLKMISSGVTVVNMMSRDLSSSCPYIIPL